MMLLQETLQHTHPIWGNAFFYLFTISTILFFVVSLSMMKFYRKKAVELKLTQQQHVARVDTIRKEHSDALEKLRLEMLKREEERTRQWMESEKEALKVLNGVSNILELSDKLNKIDADKLTKKLEELISKVDQITSKD